VTYVAMSAAEESVRADFPRDILRTEIFLGAAIMGISRERAGVGLPRAALSSAQAGDS
jgi:hypothetical protein